MSTDNKLFFFSYNEDTRKVSVAGKNLTSLDDLLPLMKEKYSDLTISSTQPDYWTADQTYGVKHKITSIDDIYPGAVIEVKYQGVKRQNDNPFGGIGVKRPRKTGPRFVARLRGLPWGCTKDEIVEFFSGITLEECHIILNPDGRASGEGIIEVGSEAELEQVLEKDKENIGSRYIEIRKSTASDIDWALQRVGAMGVTALGGGGLGIENPNNSVIRMRGLPFSATEAEIEEFLMKVEVKAARVHIIREAGVGRPSGIAYVEVASADDATKALSLDRENMGSRYIEMYKSSQMELKGSVGGGAQMMPQLLGGMGGGMGGMGGGSSCLRMRGLPWKVTEQDIIMFFAEANVTPVRIHRKSEGGEAYVEFTDGQSVAKAMTRNKAYIGSRYIELFPVSYGEVASTVGMSMPFQQRYNGSGQYRLFQ